MKLTRTQSLLRLSSLLPTTTARSSVQGLSSINEDKIEIPGKGNRKKTRNRSFNGLCRFGLIVLLYAIVVFSKKPEIPTSQNVILALILIVVLLFVMNKYKGFIQKPVQWSIGDSNNGNVGVYQGEFRNGKANGNGVYKFFANGRYEGEWIEGKYNGFGIESWAEGIEYRGEFKKGLRHGFGIYKCNTGDWYAGQWFNGQSHGVGVQYFSDGSSYVDQLKGGVKNGLGSYLTSSGTPLFSFQFSH